jgi:hypothetical protein
MARNHLFLFWTTLVLSIITWPTYGTAVSAISAQKDYVRRAHAQIDALAEGLRKAELKMNHLKKDSREECGETLKALWRKERVARTNLGELQKAAPDHWLTLRPKEDALLIHLQKSYQHLVNRYFR